jgi:NTP-dependent ternary system trypsin peptidase co-occuring protein
MLMKKAVAVMADGHEIYFEIDETKVDVLAPSTEGLSDAAGALADRLERINATILGVCRSVHEKAYNALSAAKPKEFEIEFGITLSGEAGIPLVSKGAAEAALKVVARW